MKKSTTELLHLLKKSSNISDYVEEMSEDLLAETSVSACLNRILIEKNLQKSDIIHRSGLDRGYAYEIFSGNKIPSRDKLLALCFAIPLSIDDVQQLLKHTGYPTLYARLERDCVILFALEHQLSLTDTNELLYDMDYPLLG